MMRATTTCLLLLLLPAAILWTSTSADPVHDGFVGKWSPTASDGESFYALPRTRAEAEAGTGENAWIEHGTGNTDEPFVVFCQPQNERLCPMYDLNGIIAGVQIAIPFSSAVNSSGVYPFQETAEFVRATRFGRQCWIGTAFFVNPAVLEAGGRPNLDEGTLSELWLQRGLSWRDAERIPTDPTSLLAETDFTLQNCVPTMGIHYYYDIRSTLLCSAFSPWFLLYKDDVISGIGFQAFGDFSVPIPGAARHYNEDVDINAVLYVLRDPPACLETWVPLYKLVSLHLYFISQPASTMTCPPPAA